MADEGEGVALLAIDLSADGVLHAEDGTPLEPPSGVDAGALLLAALARCSLESLRHHASRAALAIVSAQGRRRGLVTRREEDGRYAVVEARARARASSWRRRRPGTISRRSSPRRSATASSARRCGSTPSYRWTVNGVGARRPASAATTHNEPTLERGHRQPAVASSSQYSSAGSCRPDQTIAWPDSWIRFASCIPLSYVRRRHDGRERGGDALERVVVVVEDDHEPGAAEPGRPSPGRAARAAA